MTGRPPELELIVSGLSTLSTPPMRPPSRLWSTVCTTEMLPTACGMPPAEIEYVPFAPTVVVA